MHRTTFTAALTATLLAVVLLPACGKQDAVSASAPATANVPGQAAGAPAGPGSAGVSATGAPAANAAPPVSVTSVRAQKRDLPVILQATGTVTPLATVDIKAQVASIVTQVHVREGQFVRKGELLFTLDSRADEANVAKARAQLAKDEAALADTQRQLARSKQLLAQNFISQGAVDTSQASYDAALAVAAADRAAIDAARVPVSYGKVIAPSAGRIGAISVFPGSAVQANVTPMLTITQLDPIAVAFSLPQRYLPDVIAALKDGGANVTATLPDGGASVNGRLQFVDNSVDASSGSVKVKAYFKNSDDKLWPGAFVNMAMTVSTIKDAVVIPQAAIIESARGSIAYVIEEGDKAALRPVKLLQAQGDNAAVTGIQVGERVVLDGRQNLRPGSRIVERAPDAAGKGGGKPRGEGKGDASKRADAATTPSTDAPATPATPNTSAAAAQPKKSAP